MPKITFKVDLESTMPLVSGKWRTVNQTTEEGKKVGFVDETANDKLGTGEYYFDWLAFGGSKVGVTVTVSEGDDKLAERETKTTKGGWTAGTIRFKVSA